jgi:O-antigen ligase
LNRERLDTFCEHAIFGLVLAALVYAPLAMGAVQAGDFLAVELLVTGAAGLWLARLWLNPRPQLLWPPISWAVLAFVIYAVARYFTADIEYVARGELVRVLTYALAFFVTVNNLYRQDAMQRIVFVLVFLGMAISFYAAYQFLADHYSVWGNATPYPGRGSGTFFCPNHLAGFLEMILPLALAGVIAGRAKTLVKVALGYAALAMAFGLAVTISRGGWVAAAAAGLLFFGVLFLRKNFRWPVLAVALVVLVAGGIFASRTVFLKERFKQAFPGGSAGKVEDIRFQIWRPALSMWRENFWFGVGPGHFDKIFPAYRTQEIQVRPDHVHNDVIETFADWGVVGASLVTAAFVLLGLGVRKTWGYVRGSARDLGSNQSDKFALVFGAAVGLFAILLHSLVDFNLHIPANALLAVTLMALLSVCLRFATDNYWFKIRGVALKVAVSATLVVTLAALAVQEVRALRETFWLNAAGRVAFGSREQIVALKKAAAAEPKNSDTAASLGEALRARSWDGGRDYESLAQEALVWFNRAAALNPHDPLAPLRAGMCLDWIDRHDEAAPFFARAERLDPNNSYIVAHIGWHYVQLGEYAGAREWFERALRLDPQNNPVARNYLDICDRRLAAAAK